MYKLIERKAKIDETSKVAANINVLNLFKINK